MPGAGTALAELLERIRVESPLKYPAAKELAVRVLAGLFSEQSRLSQLSADGKITSEEAKVVSANASNIRRWYEALGVIQLKDPDEDDAL